jgi:hypothetical protein
MKIQVHSESVGARVHQWARLVEINPENGEMIVELCGDNSLHRVPYTAITAVELSSEFEIKVSVIGYMSTTIGG